MQFHPLFTDLTIPLENLTVVSEQTKLLDLLNETDFVTASLPTMLSNPYVMYPTVLFPALITIFVVVVLCYCLSRLNKRLVAIRKASNLVPVRLTRHSDIPLGDIPTRSRSEGCQLDSVV